MHEGLCYKFNKRVLAFWLLLRVHFDALRLAPKAYLTATKWRILGKKVRARGQFAPLLSRSPRAYELWSNLEARAQRDDDLPGDDKCLIIALILDQGNARNLAASIDSVSSQGFAFLVIPEAGEDNREALLAAINWHDYQWVMPIVAGDKVARNSAAQYCNSIAQAPPGTRIIYADDDHLDRWEQRKKPHFKPGWNADLCQHHDFLMHSCIIRTGRDDLSAAMAGPDWPRALLERALADGGTPEHIPRVLHHRCTRPHPSLPLPAAAVADALPKVSVIIPTRNGTDLLRTCITGLRATDYPGIEIIIVDNGSDDPGTLAYLECLEKQSIRVLPQPGPFNYSALNNRAVEVASGDLLCLLNNDIEVRSPDWLSIMATHALRPDIGAVGAQLLYPDGRIQHAGVVIGVGNAAGHAHRFLRPEDEGYFRRHALPQFVSAVTAACLVVRKDRFLATGGLDEANFPVAFNDVDLCLRLNRQGWQSFYEPRAVLVHHESVSRGDDRDPVGAARFAGELAALQRIWRTDEITDPFHHSNLSRASEQFTLGLL